MTSNDFKYERSSYGIFLAQTKKAQERKLTTKRKWDAKRSSVCNFAKKMNV